MSKAPVPKRKCPKCGARLVVERVDHHLSGTEKLVCQQHGAVGYLNDDSGRIYRRHRNDVDEDSD